MDPNTTLQILRDAVKDVDNVRYRQQAVTDMVEAFQVLDEWLSKGGFLPEAWQDTPVRALGDNTPVLRDDAIAALRQFGGGILAEDFTDSGLGKIVDAVVASRKADDGWAPIGPFTVMLCEECDTDREVDTYVGGVVTFRVCGHTENFKQ